MFVHIGQSNPTYSDPYLEAVDIRQIYDKFPEKKGGLKELFEKGPANAFFLVKFWVRPKKFFFFKPNVNVPMIYPSITDAPKYDYQVIRLTVRTKGKIRISAMMIKVNLLTFLTTCSGHA